jgi:hypothetical protein
MICSPHLVPKARRRIVGRGIVGVEGDPHAGQSGASSVSFRAAIHASKRASSSTSIVSTVSNSAAAGELGSSSSAFSVGSVDRELLSDGDGPPRRACR